MSTSSETPDPAEIRKHSVVLRGHRTSISLENAFWNALVASARRDGKTVNQLVTEIDAGRSGNLSSAIRVALLRAALDAASNNSSS